MTKPRSKPYRAVVLSCTKLGKELNTTKPGMGRGLFLFDQISDAGDDIEITGHGEENTYFEFTDDDGVKRDGYCKNYPDTRNLGE